MRQLFDLVGELQRLRAELNETQEELRRVAERNDETSRNVRDIAYELRLLGANEKLMLRLELELQRRLPPPRDAGE